jgi:diguanylate cyclase (GGDEF)-like protein
MSETLGTQRRPAWSAALWAFLFVDVLLMLSALVLSPRGSGFALAALTVLGVAALAVGIWRQRPDVPVAWWLLAAGSALSAGVAIAGDVVFGPSVVPGPAVWLPTLLAELSWPLLIAGLMLLARLGGRTDAAANIDSLMVALAAYLVLFAVVIHPVLGTGWAVVRAIISPLGALLVLAMAIRVVFVIGVPTVSVGLVILAMVARAVATISLIFPALATTGLGPVLTTGSLPTFSVGSLRLDSPVLPMWLAFGVLVGAAGLHPSLGRTRRRPGQRSDSLSARRGVLAAIVAVVVTIAWWFEVRHASSGNYSVLGFTIPVALSAMLLLLLVARLSLVARLAQGRAAELARRSAQLARRTDELAQAIGEQEVLQRQLRYRAMHDPLTGLSNRIVLAERMEWALSRPVGSGRHSLVLMDIDQFKNVNDTHGHPVGDELLVEASHRLVDAIPRGGTLARLGGDEFAALLEDTPEDDAVAWADGVRQSLRRPYHVAGQDLFVSTSVGLLTTDPGKPGTPFEALRDADLALHAAKAAGKNRVVVFRRELRTAQLDHARLSAGLRRAIENNELAVEYQPIVDLSTYRIVSVEALLRWNPPGEPSISPAEFIPIAEDIGLIGLIGAWVLRQACRDVRSWYDRYGIAVAVNVSPRQLDDPGFAEMVMETLRDRDLPGDALIVEITESSLMATSPASAPMDQLHRLRSHDIRVAIDDFGTGYSSLASVARLPVDIVKLDRSFIQGSGEDAGTADWTFARAILEMLNALRLRIVAEGVETAEQAESLRKMHYPLVQGFFFAGPMSREQLDSVLSNSDRIR